MALTTAVSHGPHINSQRLRLPWRSTGHCRLTFHWEEKQLLRNYPIWDQTGHREATWLPTWDRTRERRVRRCWRANATGRDNQLLHFYPPRPWRYRHWLRHGSFRGFVCGALSWLQNTSPMLRLSYTKEQVRVLVLCLACALLVTLNFQVLSFVYVS